MRNPFKKKLTEKQIGLIVDDVCDEHSNMSNEEKLKQIAPLRSKMIENDKIPLSLLHVIKNANLTHNENLEIAQEIVIAYPDSEEVILEIASAAEKFRNIDYLNDPPFSGTFSDQMIRLLKQLWENNREKPEEKEVVEHLSSFAKQAGRNYDAIAEKAYKRTIELYPDVSWPQYNWGLFCKTRGRFGEGAIANKRAIELAENASEGAIWNLGICATGSRDMDKALEIWKQIGNKIEPGRFGLPEGNYASVKVRLAEFPLAERDATNDDPGTEETIWIERLSPCHGIIQSVLYADLGVNYGDVIMFDGAPITYHKVGVRDVPVFPHLATLKRRNYQLYDFVGLQEEQRQLLDLSSKLTSDTIIYPLSELYQILCWECYNNPDSDHSDHSNEDDKTDISIINGQIAAPPDLPPTQLLSEIDSALSNNSALRIFSPDLCLASGNQARAVIEQKRFNELAK